MKIGSLKHKKARILLLTISTLFAASFTLPARADFATGLKAGVQAAAEVIKIYQSLNPPQTGRARIINNSSEEVTVRSYNNNDWAKVVAAGQLNLQPGQQGYITASTDPIVILWKRGRYGNLTGFGPDDLGQDTIMKGTDFVYVIGDGNTPRSAGRPGNTPNPPPSNAQNLVPLQQYWSAQRQDNFTTATDAGGKNAIAAGYGYVRNEACVFKTQQPGTVPLNLYWNAQRGDNFTAATNIGAQSATQAGYGFAGVEGYVYPNQQPGTVPLNLYWNAQRGDNFTTATTAGEQSAKDAGYTFVRAEGYALPADRCK
jgi:hypothetical protein